MKTYYVRDTTDMGRGVFADRDFKAGELICYCELLVFSATDKELFEETDLKYYTFRFNDTQDCLVLGDGELFNHSDRENVSYELVTIPDAIKPRTLMKFTTTRPILQDEQMFINYSADIQVDTKQYTINMVG